MMRFVLLGTCAMVVLLVGASLPKVFSPATALVAQAVRVLGPVSGWRCVNLATYVYDPRRESADSGLVAEQPEAAVLNVASGTEIERVEVSLRGSDAVVWTMSSSREQRVFVLTPGSLSAVGTPADRPATCYAHQGAWQVVAEHGLQ